MMKEKREIPQYPIDSNSQIHIKPHRTWLKHSKIYYFHTDQYLLAFLYQFSIEPIGFTTFTLGLAALYMLGLSDGFFRFISCYHIASIDG